MQLSSGHTDTLNLSSAEGTASTINPNLSGTPDDKNPQAELFSRVLESERPDVPNETAAELPEQSKSALHTLNTESQKTTEIDPRSLVKSHVAALGVDSDARSFSAESPDEPVTKVLTDTETTVVSATDEMVTSVESDSVVADNPATVDTEELAASMLRPEAENEMVSAAYVTEARASTPASSPEKTLSTANKTPVAQPTAMWPQGSLNVVKPAATVTGSMSAVPVDSLPSASSVYNTAEIVDAPALVNTKPATDNEQVQVPVVISNRKTEPVSGVAGELLKASPGVVNSRIGAAVPQAAIAPASSLSAISQESPNPVGGTLPGLTAQTAPGLTINTATSSGWQQLETVGRLRTQLNQSTTQPITTVSASSEVGATITPDIEKPALIPSSRTDRAGLSLEHSSAAAAIVPTVMESAGKKTIEANVKTSVDRIVTEGTALAANTVTSTDARPAPISAGEFMIAQAVTSTAVNTLTSPTIDGLTRSTGALDLQESLMPAKLGNQIRVMAEGGIQSATLQVKPADLGPIQISVVSENDKLTVNILASNVMTRDLLDTALPRLREQLSQGQFNQVDVNVSEQGKGQQQNSAYDQNASHYQAEQEVAQQDEQVPMSEGPDSERETKMDAMTSTRSVAGQDGRIDAYI